MKYFIYGKEIIPYKNLNPDNSPSLPIEWNAIDSLGYEKILWSYSKNFTNNKFLCNGIVIPDSYSTKALDFELIQSKPQISIFDDNAILPLTLDRNSISEKVSFNDELLEDIYKDFIAYLLVFNKNSYVNNKKVFIHESMLNHPCTEQFYSYQDETAYGVNTYSNSYYMRKFLNTILISKKGYIINYNYFIQKLKKINALFIQFNSNHEGGFEFDIRDRFILFSDNKLSSIPDYINAIEAKTWNDDTETHELFNSRIFIKTEKYNYLFNSQIKRTSNWLKGKCKIQYEHGDFTCLNLDNPKTSIITDTFLNNYSRNIHFIREYEITCPYIGDEILNKLLQKYIGDDVVIPYSLEERKKKYPLAFSELKRYMEKYTNKN